MNTPTSPEQIIMGLFGMFLFAFIFQVVWNLLAGQFGFNPIDNYWVAFAIWFVITFAISIVYVIIHGNPKS